MDVTLLQNKLPEERFKEQVETLVAMGFTDRLANLQGMSFADRYHIIVDCQSLKNCS